jgi:UDP-N-acetylglucosamine--N-acetylmuramyl-(pentapeptide) pyrophosphoryl-undecaprenol N-acetylglucosamine transferase
MIYPVLIVGSRSGGHILPGLAKGKEWYARGVNVYFIAEDRSLDRSLLKSELWLAGTTFLKLRIPMLREWWNYPWYFLQFLIALVRCIFVLYGCQISRVIAMGGYSSVPVCCAAFLLRIPYELYEFNAELGRAVHFLLYKAETVHCCFPEALDKVPLPLKKFSQYPIRYRQEDIIDSARARTALGLHPHRYALFVVGGSQGSQALSLLVVGWLQKLNVSQRSKIQIIHQTGEHLQVVRNYYKELNIEPILFDYVDNLAPYYCASDLVITRAGAGVLHEIIHWNKRALIIPLEAATTHHQVSNAQSVQRRNPDLWKMILQGNQEQVYEFLDAQVQGE